MQTPSAPRFRFSPRSWPLAVRLLSLVLVPWLLLLSGCNDQDNLKEDEQRIVVGFANIEERAGIAHLCPDDKGGVEISSAQIVATIYGRDGKLQPGVAVDFQSSDGEVSPLRRESNSEGQAISAVTITGRGVGDEITVSASISNGETDDQLILNPDHPFLIPSTLVLGDEDDDGRLETGETFSILIAMESENDAGMCNLSRIFFQLNYDPAYFAPLPSEEDPSQVETLILPSNGLDLDGGAEVEVSATDDGMGIVTVDFRQSQFGQTGAPRGFTGNGRDFLSLTFTAIDDTEGLSEDELPLIGFGPSATVEFYSRLGSTYRTSPSPILFLGVFAQDAQP